MDSVDDLKNKAMANKFGLRKKFVNIPIGQDEYQFRISGIGSKAVKIEKYIKYDEIIEAISQGNDDGLEYMIKMIIEEYEPEEDKND